ncbi:MAG TPA: hypothetical protein VH117_12200 [Edaphobacter sp.]|jgi:hypothetical protein|nr:hypothetical protein [Edaphobacter sp.]
MEPYLGPLESIGDAPALRHGAYAIDDVVVAQSCLSPELVGVLVQDGFDSLREGTYLSMWRSNPDVLSRLDVTTEIPDGANASVTVETGNADGKVLHSETMNLTSGHHTYPLGRMMTSGAQVRIRTRLVVAGDGVSPMVRAVVLSGVAKPAQWTTPADWREGIAGKSVAINYVDR